MPNVQPQAGVPWSIFQQGGGQGAAVTWAEDALREIGAPLTVANEQFVYDWETSEGGGGWYNPLNQGDDPGHPSYTSTGSQYGGGAANYVSYSAGLKGFRDYMNMPSYSMIKGDLQAKNPTAARDDLIMSPWAQSHYGGGSAFSDAPLPGHKSALKGGAGPIDKAQTTSFLTGVTGLTGAVHDLTSADFWERVGLVIGGFIFIIIGLVILALPGARSAVSEAASTKRAITSLTGGSDSPGGPTEEEKADRARRLDLAERNVAVGEAKVANVQMRERRLANARPKAQHTGGREPNPNPQHS